VGESPSAKRRLPTACNYSKIPKYSGNKLTNANNFVCLVEYFGYLSKIM
jgi:hypothetical protein